MIYQGKTHLKEINFEKFLDIFMILSSLARDNILLGHIKEKEKLFSNVNI